MKMTQLIGLALLTVSACDLFAEDKITVHFAERPPYVKKQADGSPAGLVGTPIAEAVKAAGISVEWKITPNGDQPKIIEANIGADCSLGFFKNAKREAFAKFSKPLYRDKPWVALVNNKVDIKAGAKLEEVLSNKQIRLLVKEGASYGPYLDGLLAKLKPNTKTTTVEFNQMAPLIKKDDADMMFVSQEEATYFLKLAGLTLAEMKLLTFPDVPKGDERYLWCSKSVSDQVMDKLNQHITAAE